MHVENTLENLLIQRNELEQKIEKIKSIDRQESLEKIKMLVALYDFAPNDIFGKVTIKVKPKYSNPETGETWSGRGKTPRWLVGKDRSEFQI